MSDLTEFLLARIAEDEEVARAAAEHPVPTDADAVYVTWRRDDTGWVPGARGEWVQGSSLMRRWDPARVLAECEAKGQIVEDHAEYARDMTVAPSEFARGRRHAATLALARLAAVYADHPDYRQEWRP